MDRPGNRTSPESQVSGSRVVVDAAFLVCGSVYWLSPFANKLGLHDHFPLVA